MDRWFTASKTMKDYALYPHASVSMSSDEQFKNELEKLFAENDIAHVVESGTYRGLGSTTLLANAIVNSRKPLPNFITIEVDKDLHTEATANLARFSFVKPVWGISIALSEAKKFIETDDAISNHQQYPDVFIDILDNPKQFYLDEINGQLSKFGEQRQGWFGRLLKRIPGLGKEPGFEQNVFKRLIPAIKKKGPLFLLDSAGGVGYCEFKKVRQLMDGNSHFLILDDIHHLKHFRSYRDILADSRYSILAKNIPHGWLIAKYTAA